MNLPFHFRVCVVCAAALGLGTAALKSSELAVWYHRNPMPLNHDLVGIAYGAGKFVAVGRDGIMAISIDGLAWRRLESGLSGVLNAVTYAAGMFVAVGSNGIDVPSVVTSVDGETWVVREAGSGFYLNAISFGDSNFVAVGSLGGLVTSSDGANWVQRVTGTSTELSGVAHGNERFVAVGGSHVVVSSDQGATWTSQNTGNEARVFQDVAFGDGRFVAVGGTIHPFFTPTTVAVSVDGNTWADHSPMPQVYLTEVFRADGHFLALNLWGDPILASTDGLTWHSHSQSLGGASNILAFAHGGGSYVGVGPDGVIITSRDAIAWTRVDGGPVFDFSDVKRFENKYVTVGDGGKIAVSLDGALWVSVEAGVSAFLHSICSAEGRLVAVGSKGTIVTSDDGFTWTLRESGTQHDLLGVRHVDGAFTAVGSRGVLLSSSDGFEWALGSQPEVRVLFDVAHGNGTYVGVGSEGGIVSSGDGTQWTKRETGLGFDVTLRNVIFAAGRFVAVGDFSHFDESPAIVTSVDGMVWEKHIANLDGSASLYAITFGGGRFVAVGEGAGSGSGRQWVVTSTDGIFWEGRDPRISKGLRGVMYDEGTYLAVGSGGTVIHSAVFPPTLIAPPVHANTTAGHSLTLSAVAAGFGELSYQWQRNGVDVTGGNSPTLVLGSVQSFQSGEYSVVVRNDGGTVTSDAATIAVSEPPPSNARLTNLSTRALTLTGDNVLIPGLVVAGPGNKKLLIRAVGPTLAEHPYNLAGTLPNPRLRLKHVNFSTNPPSYDDVTANDDWSTSTNLADILARSDDLGAFPLLEDSADAVLLVELEPGQYSVVTDDPAQQTGIAIVEFYDADEVGAGSTSRLINISTRGYVGTGDNIMIPGFVVSNEGPKTLLIRVVGPTLGEEPYNVPGVLADPTLTIYRHDFVNNTDDLILTNDDWSTGPGADRTRDVAAQVSAFPLPEGSKDAAFVVTLNPGVYTVHARGNSATGSGEASDTEGVALVEVYAVP